MLAWFWLQQTPEAVAARAVDRYIATARAGVLLTHHDTADATTPARPRSIVGGIPVRVGEETWPVSLDTGEPMVFVAQIVRDDINAPFMGRIRILRVFADLRWFVDGYAEDGGFEIRVTETGSPADYGQWHDNTIDEANAGFQRELRYDNRVPAYELTSTPAVLGNDDVLWRELLARDDVRYDEASALLDAELATRGDMAAAIRVPQDTSSIGGNPYWVQSTERSRLPYFMQLVPPGPLMIGDIGHVYLFLDPDDPGRGFETRVQMY